MGRRIPPAACPRPAKGHPSAQRHGAGARLPRGNGPWADKGRRCRDQKAKGRVFPPGPARDLRMLPTRGQTKGVPAAPQRQRAEGFLRPGTRPWSAPARGQSRGVPAEAIWTKAEGLRPISACPWANKGRPCPPNRQRAEGFPPAQHPTLARPRTRAIEGRACRGHERKGRRPPPGPARDLRIPPLLGNKTVPAAPQKGKGPMAFPRRRDRPWPASPLGQPKAIPAPPKGKGPRVFPRPCPFRHAVAAVIRRQRPRRCSCGNPARSGRGSFPRSHAPWPGCCAGRSWRSRAPARCVHRGRNTRRRICRPPRP